MKHFDESSFSWESFFLARLSATDGNLVEREMLFESGGGVNSDGLLSSASSDELESDLVGTMVVGVRTGCDVGVDISSVD